MVEPRVLMDGARLLHIGFRKCGSTALQSALRRARGELAALGVVYPGAGLNHTEAALAVTGRTNGWASLGARPRSRAKWDELVSSVSGLGAEQRAVMSSEFLDVPAEPTIRSIVSGLGSERVHVVVTVRPLTKILPSAWQQNVQFGARRSYDEWLRVVLDGDESMKTYRAFWERHDHGDVLSRWVDVVGPKHVTLVVLDERDRELPFRTFETMLGVPAGTLEEVPGRANRSMTLAEAEFVRQINVELLSHKVSWDEYTYWIRRGASHRMWWKRTPGPDEPRIQTPRWALERAAEVAADLPGRIEGLGIEVVGDLANLAPPVPATAQQGHDEDPAVVPIEAAVQAILGACFSSRKLPTAVPTPPSTTTDPEQPTGRELVGLVGGYVRHKLSRRRTAK